MGGFLQTPCYDANRLSHGNVITGPAIVEETKTTIVVPKEGAKLTEGDVIHFCKDKMAPFKAPKGVIFTRSLPKTGSAKIYKYKLREKYSLQES